MEVPYKYCSLEELSIVLDKDRPVFMDTETEGFYCSIRLLQVFQEGLEEVHIVDRPDPLALCTTVAKFNTVWHNAHYDLTTLQAQAGVKWQPELFEDTFLLSRLAFPHEERFALDEVFKYVLGYDPYERQNLNKKVLQKSDWSKHILTSQQLTYAATDVYFMPDVWEAVSPMLGNINYELDKHTLKHCLDFQANGMPVNADRLLNRYTANQKRIAELAVPINVNSWQQVRPYIGENESDDIALARFSFEGNDRATAVRETRKLRKQLSFLDKFNTDDSRIYGKFKPSARSGRLTSNDQNLQQIPRLLKEVFGYHSDDGRVLIYSDYAQLELRTICAITQCLQMEELFRDNRDLHGFTADMMFGEGWEKWQRDIAKTYNFNLLYGGGIGMIQTILLKQVGIMQSDADTNRARKRWRNLWVEIYRWQEAGISAYQKGKLGSTPLGRQYKAKMMTDQLNIENQGAGAEVAKLALHYMYKFYMAEWEADNAFLSNFIHDSYIVDAPDDPSIYMPIAEQMAKAMQLAWFEMSKLFRVKDIPMPVEVKVGYNWGDIEAGDNLLYEFELEPYTYLEEANNG